MILTRNEVLTGLNKPERWWLALVGVDTGRAGTPAYVLHVANAKPHFNGTAVPYSLEELVRGGGCKGDSPPFIVNVLGRF